MRCFHCTENVLDPARWQVEFDGVLRDVCCIGCQAVMQAIVDAGLDDYYRFRTGPAVFGVIPDSLASSLDRLMVYDEPEISERYLQAVETTGSDQSLVDVSLAIEGMTCGACVWVLERAIRSIPGVDNARVNFSSSRARVRFDPTRLPLSTVLKRVSGMGFQGKPFDAREREASLKKETRIFLQRLFVAGIATMQVMMYALPAYLSGEGDIDASHEQLLRWASLVLTVPVLVYSAQPFFKGAWQDIKRRQPGMDVPVSVGILVAFFSSVWATVTGQGETYFDSVSMFVFLLLGARYLEWTARRRAMRTIDDISACEPEMAQRLKKGDVELVPAARLQVNDLILVDSGERVPVDSRVWSGVGAINNALVTGESVPQAVRPGDLIAGGALLTGAPLQCQVIRRQAASTLSVIDRLIDRGASEKPRTVQIADRIATAFVTVLLGLAALVWFVWMQIDPGRAGQTAIAVLVVSCPCALSLATPAAVAAATSDLLRHRLLITRGHAIETLAKVSDVVFDKTGTLTQGAPAMLSIQTGKGLQEREALQLAVAMEAGSSHPYAFAFRQVLGADASTSDALGQLAQLGWTVDHMNHSAGHGVAAQLDDGGSLKLGSARWCELDESVQMQWQASDTAPLSAASEIYLVSCRVNQAGQTELVVLARFLLGDNLRAESKPLVAKLQKQGMRVHLLSGDRPAAVEVVARELQLSSYRAAQTPEQKQAFVSELQADGAVVLMVGDGINDAPVLAIADVSLAAGDATSLARTASDVISLVPGLEGLDFLLGKARQSLHIIRQNLVWAALYNLSAIPLAAIGYIPPWAAAIGMAGSSLLVVGNAQRLWTRDNADTTRWRSVA